jgi:hypothetical protein
MELNIIIKILCTSLSYQFRKPNSGPNCHCPHPPTINRFQKSKINHRELLPERTECTPSKQRSPFRSQKRWSRVSPWVQRCSRKILTPDSTVKDTKLLNSNGSYKQPTLQKNQQFPTTSSPLDKWTNQSSRPSNPPKNKKKQSVPRWIDGRRVDKFVSRIYCDDFLTYGVFAINRHI